MNDHALTPEHQAKLSALTAEFMRQLERVGVDMGAARARLREAAPPIEHRISDAESTVTHTVDVSAIIETLQRLPDGAGTDAFVTAYNARP